MAAAPSADAAASHGARDSKDSQDSRDSHEMLAVVRADGRTSLSRVRRPTLAAPDDVIVRVAFAGVCRTDLRVADGGAAVSEPRILGHELAGVVEEAGPRASVARGARVSIDPYVACRACAGCAREAPCEAPAMLGLDLDGAFGSHVRVPAASLVPLPDDVPLDVGAFVEPVAATLAILRASIARADRGVVLGRGRIARLAYDVLRAKGFERVALHDPERDASLPASSFDFAVETALDAATVACAARLVRPRGRIVLKSRAGAPLAIDFGPLLRKEIALEPVWYGDFREAAALVGRLEVRARLAAPRPLAAFAEVFAAARDERAGKQLFALSGER